MSQPEPQDVITYEQLAVEVVKDREKVEMFFDQGYWPVLAILREGTYTVREITKKSNELVEKKELPTIKRKMIKWEVPTNKDELEKLLKKLADWEILHVKGKLEERDLTKDKVDELLSKGKLSDSDIKLIKEITIKYKLSHHLKSDKTIYRYVKDLTKAGLIVAAGQRVVIGKTATETLYARKARIFILRQHEDDTWKCDECKETLRIVGKLISLSKGIKQPSVDCLAKLMSKIDTFHEDEQIRLFDQFDEEVKELIKDSSFKETSHILSTFKTIYILLNQEFFAEEISECLKK